LRKEYKITNIIMGKKENVYLGPLPGTWKLSFQVRGPEA
jgi:hypothetical protein